MGSNLEKLSLNELLRIPELPHRLIVYFASQVAKDVSAFMIDPASLAAVDLAERYGLGEDIIPDKIHEIYVAASRAYPYTKSSSSFAFAASIAAAHAAYGALYPIMAASSSASYAAETHGSSTEEGKKLTEYKQLLIHLINTRLSEVEKLLIFN